MRTYHRLKKDVGDAVMMKYDNKCTKCGATEKLCVHHVLKMATTDEKYNDISNLTVLCKTCHMSIHRQAKDIVPNKITLPGNRFGRRGKNIPPIKCSIENCDNMQHAKALCKKHYEQQRRKKIR